MQKYIGVRLHPKLGLLLALGFVLFTIIGTLTHELGHIAFAKAQGFETSLHYGYMHYKGGPLSKELDVIYYSNQDAIDNELPFPEKERWEANMAILEKKSRWVTIGGPFQTVLFGSIGLLLLYRRRRSIIAKGMKLLDWLYTFLALFWLRELANPVVALLKSTMEGKPNPFGGWSDELGIANSLDWWAGSISLPLALMAFSIAVYIIFKIIPKMHRFTFIIAGLVGGVFGFFFWLVWVGPIVMP